MADQILSQEEIDALISAMDKGDVTLEADAPDKSRATSYDLTSQQRKVLRGQFEALELIYDEFGKLLRSSLSSTLGRTMEAKFVSTEMVKFGVFFQSFSNPTGFTIFSMDPLAGSGLLVVEPALAFSLIDCMFGGTGKPMNKIREFTLIEQGVVRKFSAEVLKMVEKAWSTVFPIEIVIKKSVSKPQFVHLVSSEDTVVTIVFAISGEEFSGNLCICIPYLMLEPVKEKLSFKSLAEIEQSSKVNEQLLRLLGEVNVGITVELGRVMHTIGDVISLQAGDVIKLSSGPQDPVLVKVEQVAKYEGFPGIVKGNRAVEITSVVRKSGGK